MMISSLRRRFRVRGDVVEIFPATNEGMQFFGDEIDRIREVEALTGQVLGEVDHLAILLPLTVTQ